MQSILDVAGLPGTFGYVLLVLGLILTLAPWFPGHDFGIVKIPDFRPALRRSLQIIGPLLFVSAVAIHVPMVGGDLPEPAATQSSVEEQLRGSQASAEAVSRSGWFDSVVKWGWTVFGNEDERQPVAQD